MANNTQTLELANGEKVELTLTFAKLYQLRNRKPQEYEKFNDVVMNGTKDMFDFMRVNYTAYLCSNVDNLDACMSFEDFVNESTYDINMQADIAQGFLSSKKKSASASPS